MLRRDSEDLKEVAAMLEQDPGTNCSLWREVHRGTDFLAVNVACWRPALEKFVLDGLYHMERIPVGAVLGELLSMGRAHAGAVSEGLYPRGATTHQRCVGLFWKGLGTADRSARVFLSL